MLGDKIRIVLNTSGLVSALKSKTPAFSCVTNPQGACDGSGEDETTKTYRFDGKAVKILRAVEFVREVLG